MPTIGHMRQQRLQLNTKYQDYLAQWDKPRYRFLNRYNLFYDFNYRDRRWLRKTRRHLEKLSLRIKQIG